MTRSWLAVGSLLLSLGAVPAFGYSEGGGGGAAAVAAIQQQYALATRDLDAVKKAQEAIDFKEWDQAIAILVDLTTRFDRSADLENLLGFSYRMLGQYQQAFAYYDRTLAIDPMHKGALEYEGEAYLETDQLPKAEANLASLRSACAGACKEVALLQSAIDRYKAKARIN